MIAEKGPEMVRDAGAGLVVQEVMLMTIGGKFTLLPYSSSLRWLADKSRAIESLVKPLSEPYGTEADEEDSTHILNLPHAVRTYRTLLSGGHFSRKTESIDLIAPELRTELAKAAWASIISENPENALDIALGEGTFVVAELVQALADGGMGGEVKKVLGKKEISQIEASTRNGAGLLVEKLRAL
jgi:pumilio family protein 6